MAGDDVEIPSAYRHKSPCLGNPGSILDKPKALRTGPNLQNALMESSLSKNVHLETWSYLRPFESYNCIIETIRHA